MSYDAKMMQRALRLFERDKQRRKDSFAEREKTVYAKLPRVEQIDRELRATMSKIIASALRRGVDPAPALRVIRDENLDLQREKAALLQSAGYPGDYLVEKPNCPRCADSGYCGAELCSCLQEYYAREQLRELSKLLDLGTQSFDSFSLDYYDRTVWAETGVSPRENMETVYENCVHYARHFGPRSGNLLLTGGTGLGKTFLSACIAREVSDSGFSVVYDSATHIFAQFEAQKFGRDEGDEAAGDIRRFLHCDLLILDDLGTEMTTSFVQSALYQIINTRLITGKKTILNSNLLPDEIGKRYSPQIYSRVEGEYQILFFFGEDIRHIKAKRRQN